MHLFKNVDELKNRDAQRLDIAQELDLLEKESTILAKKAHEAERAYRDLHLVHAALGDKIIWVNDFPVVEYSKTYTGSGTRTYAVPLEGSPNREVEVFQPTAFQTAGKCTVRFNLNGNLHHFHGKPALYTQLNTSAETERWEMIMGWLRDGIEPDPTTLTAAGGSLSAPPTPTTTHWRAGSYQGPTAPTKPAGTITHLPLPRNCDKIAVGEIPLTVK